MRGPLKFVVRAGDTRATFCLYSRVVLCGRNADSTRPGEMVLEENLNNLQQYIDRDSLGGAKGGKVYVPLHAQQQQAVTRRTLPSWWLLPGTEQAPGSALLFWRTVATAVEGASKCTCFWPGWVRRRVRFLPSEPDQSDVELQKRKKRTVTIKQQWRQQQWQWHGSSSEIWFTPYYCIALHGTHTPCVCMCIGSPTTAGGCATRSFELCSREHACLLLVVLVVVVLPLSLVAPCRFTSKRGTGPKERPKALTAERVRHDFLFSFFLSAIQWRHLICRCCCCCLR